MTPPFPAGRRRAGPALALMLLAAASARSAAAEGPPAGGHGDPAAGPAAPVARDARRETLAELWQRRVLGPDMHQASPDDLKLLELIRKAQAAGAIGDLRRRFGSLEGLAVETILPGDTVKRLLLTRTGYERYVFARSQDAIAFFERKGVDAKWVFSLRNTEGRPLFKGSVLTEDGDLIYRRGALGMAVFWVLPSGEVMGTRRPPARPAPSAPAGTAVAAPAASAPAVPAGPAAQPRAAAPAAAQDQGAGQGPPGGPPPSAPQEP